MKKIREMIEKIPRWGIVAGPAILMLQYSSYLLGDLVSHLAKTDSWAFASKIPAIDDRIPLVPVFVAVYVFSYTFWIIGYIVISLTPKRNYVNYVCTLGLSCFICFLTFVFAPTYMNRVAEGVIAQTYEPGVFNWLLGFIYRYDGWETGRNLLPSLHCLASTVCYLFVRKQPEIPRGFQIYTLIMAALICASTVLTKQHYIIDAPAGVGLAIICCLIVRKADPIRWLDKKSAGEKENEN